MRTVIIGAPLAGKSTCIRALARALNGVVGPRRLSASDHPSGFETAIGFAVAHDGGEQAFWTLPGTVWSPDAWDELLSESLQTILVLDAHPVREAQNAESVARLQRARLTPHRGSVVLTKADLLGEPEAYRQRDRLLRGTEQANWPTYVHTAATSDLDRARDLAPGWF